MTAVEGLSQAASVGTAIFAQSGAIASNPMYAANQLGGAAAAFNKQPQSTVVVVGGQNGTTSSTQTNGTATDATATPLKNAGAAKDAEAKKDEVAAKMSKSSISHGRQSDANSSNRIGLVYKESVSTKGCSKIFPGGCDRDH